jgi:HEPN domain-containing protein
MKKMTAEWVRKSEADLRMARLGHADPKPLHDQVCFHCQRCCEKYIKALMQEIGLTIPKTHSLVALQNLLAAHHSKLRKLRRGLDFMTRFAVEGRYPGTGRAPVGSPNTASRPLASWFAAFALS